MIEVYQILEALESDNSRLEKESILRKNSDNKILKKIFELSCDPYVNYYVSKFKKPQVVETTESCLDSFILLLDKLSKREITGNAAKDAVISEFSKMSKLEQKWCERIILKNLRCGVSDTTVNKIWPGTIKPFAVALAETLDAKTTDGEFEIPEGEVTYPVYVEPKLDGLRLIAVKENGKVTLYTRNGNEIDTPGIQNIKNILENSSYDNIVLDGELLDEDGTWNSTISNAMTKK